jgi:tetratricopeptide (TPR) repeat protein
LTEFQELHRRQPEDDAYLGDLATAYHRMAGLEEQVKDFAEAHAHALQAVALFSELSARHPGEIRRRTGWTFAMQRLGSIKIWLQDLPGAFDVFQQVLPIREQLNNLDVHDARAQVNLANSHAAVGYVLLKMGKPTAAQPHFERQRKIDDELAKKDPVRVEHQYSLSEAHENLGLAAFQLRRKEQARSELKEALRIYDVLAARGAISAEYAQVPDRIRKELAEVR